MTQINVAFGVTKDWLQYTYILICSILSNASADDSYKFYILCDSVDDNFSKTVNALDSIKKSEYKFIIMDNSWFEGAIHDPLGVSSSYRLKLPSLVDDDKILYLDSDTIANSDIAELYNYNIEDYYLAAVEDKTSDLMSPRVKLTPEEGPFVNGGVLLMNLKKFREDNLEEIIFKKLRESYFYTDQDVINDICRKKILSLPLKYNLMCIKCDSFFYKSRKDELKMAKQSPVIIHYIAKPWIRPSLFSNIWHYHKNKLIYLLQNS